VMGLRVLARGFPNRAVLEGAARQALSVLGAEGPSVRKRTLTTASEGHFGGRGA
jgi:hypothetical protein